MDSSFSPVWLLPLLEQPFAEVSTDLAGALASLNFAAPAPETVCLRQLLLSALASDSEYWAHCATHWLEQGFPLDLELCQTLLQHCSDKRFTQAIRHRLQPLARRWLRLNAPAPH
ncbi:hypothetical protein J4P02_11315 [Pseudomonas sp. NFXW11]|uniref:hypothetical protein n=1 Tax=Pseudomonas sp. NFXW11 TaxID=2819531 RepID=UPI003CEFFA0D